MLDLFLQLIDRLVRLVEHGDRADERLFGEYVQPTFSILERIHLDYLQILKVLRSDLLYMLTTESPMIIVGESARTKSLAPGLLIPDSYDGYYASAEYRNTVEALLSEIRRLSLDSLLARLRSTLHVLEQQRLELEPVRVQIRRRAELVATAKLPRRVRSFFAASLEYANVSLLPDDNQTRLPKKLGTHTGSLTAATMMVNAVNLLVEDLVDPSWNAKSSADLWISILAEIEFVQSRQREGWATICRNYEYLQLSLKLRVMNT